MSVFIALSSSAIAKGTLANGTPYAAETSASIIGTADIRRVDDNTTYNVCETQSSEDKVDEYFSFDWAANYPHVTVPVADSRELGKAYKRLHVQAQPTSEGHGGLMTGTYDIEGSGPPTQEGNQAAGGSDCTKKPYGGTGKFYGLGTPDYVREDLRSFFGDPFHVFLFTMTPLFARPASYTDSFGNPVGVYDKLSSDYDLVPEPAGLLQTKPTWDSVPADFSIDELKKLARHRTLKLRPNVYSGTINCGDAQPNDVSYDACTLQWTFRWTVVLHRKFLYKTKRAHRR